MSEYSELDLLETRLKHLLKELNSCNQTQKHSVNSRDISNRDPYLFSSKDAVASKYNKYLAYCSSEEPIDSGTDSEPLKESTTSIYSTLKQLKHLEKGLKRKELELKKRELQDRINGVKLKITQGSLDRNMSIERLKKKNSNAEKRKKKSPKGLKYKNLQADISCKKKSSLVGILESVKRSILNLDKDSKTDVCQCAKKGFRTGNDGVCACEKKISFRTAACSTDHMPRVLNPNAINVTEPKISEKTLKKEKWKKPKLKRILHKWQDMERSCFSPCRCDTAGLSSPFERMVQDAYGDCFPMTLRSDRQIGMYDNSLPPKPPRRRGGCACACCRALWLYCVKLFCSPCLICFVCCYTCCSPHDDSATYKL